MPIEDFQENFNEFQNELLCWYFLLLTCPVWLGKYSGHVYLIQNFPLDIHLVRIPAIQPNIMITTILQQIIAHSIPNTIFFVKVFGR